jgi:recombination protein RecR
MSEYILPLERLIEQFRRLPGIGKKTAVRLALACLDGDRAEQFASALIDAKNEIGSCNVCHNMCVGEVCDICASDSRDHSVICVVEDVRSILAIERMGAFNGVYHVLGGVLSPMKGVSAEDLNISDLLERANDGVREVLIACNATVEGETTAMYISKKLSGLDVTVSRLAYGIPVGADLEYADETTLRRAIEGRQSI